MARYPGWCRHVAHKRNKKDTVLCIRFSVAEQDIQITSQFSYAKTNNLRSSHQNIDFKLQFPTSLNYSGDDQLSIQIRQNHQSQNLLTKLPTGQFNLQENSLSFHHKKLFSIVPTSSC